MRQVLLNGTYYKIAGEILKRSINPWKAQVRQTGGREYSDFSQAEMEEYHDFRNGIGKKRGLGSDARLDWSEGIDFATEGQAVLGSLVNSTDFADWQASTAYSLLDFVIPTTPDGQVYECTTAGTSGSTEPSWDTTPGNTTSDGTVTWTCRNYLATVKIIDFQDKTYFIQNSRILRWNTSTSKLDCVDNTFASPTDAIVITDGTDEYLIVSSATGAIYTVDGDTWTISVICKEDFTTYTEKDDNAKLTVTAPKALAADADRDEDVYLYKDMGTGFFDALDIDFEIYIADTSEDGAQGGMAVANTVGSVADFATTDISAFAARVGAAYRIYLSRGDAVATDYYTGSANTIYYCTLERVGGCDDVYLKIYSDSARATLVDTLTVAGYSTTTYRYVYGFVNNNATVADQNFDGYVQNLYLHILTGYLAEYDNRLYSISTNGKTVGYSAAKNIDKWGGSFELTGNYGTVYDLFEGKLLSDGSNTLYFLGTQGLFTLDTTNEKAYKQEVSYPPLTYAGHKGLYWNANVWIATGYGILKVASSMATEIGPNQDDGLPGGYQGYIYDMVTVNNWLVFCVNGSTTAKSSILKRNSSLGGNLQVYTALRVHKTKDTSNTATSAKATNTATLYTLLNEIKADYNTHIASTTYHDTADTTNTITSADATTEATAVALANEIRTDLATHPDESGVHIDDDEASQLASTAATDEATAITLANIIKVNYNVHLLRGGNSIACLHHSPSSLYTNGRLWFGEGTAVKYMMFPDTTANVKQISTYQYVDDSGYGKLPIFRNLAAIPKVALGMASITKSCDADDYIEVFYGVNGADPTTSLGTLKSSPRPTLLTWGSGLGLEFYTMQLAVKFYRNGGNTTSPELESLMFYWYAVPTRISAWTLNIDATGPDGDGIFTNFETIYDTNTLVAFYPSGDSNKTSYNVKLTQMPSREWWEEQGAKEGYFQVVVEEIFKG